MSSNSHSTTTSSAELPSRPVPLTERMESADSFYYEDNDDDGHYAEYDDFELGGSGGGGGGSTGKMSRREQSRGGGAGRGTIYSSKHVRAKEAQLQQSKPTKKK
jgi:hypothetical protein